MTRITEMPASGTPWEELRAEMVRRGEDDARWREGRTAVYVFNAGEDVARVQQEAYALYMSENGLGPLAFPSLKTMEEEVVGMGLWLLHGDADCVGHMTSGGTDSITMAIKAARDFAREQRGLAGQGNLVVPYSAHPAFDKACALMGLELRRVPVADDLRADVAAMRRACDERTVLVTGSAPSFPYGLIDPIAELGEMAQAAGVWLHVDACVGGYIAPFVRRNGGDVPPFDFEVPGVCSISADLHKYGYCAKGASTVLFRSDEHRRHMVFDHRDWPGGRMITPTLAGTRPGGAIAAAWAVMRYLGVDGYRRKHALVTAAREAIEAGVREMGFEVLGSPQLGIVAFAHPEVDALALYRRMYHKGWFASFTTEPPALHLMLSPFHAEVTDDYLRDLRAALAEEEATASSPGPPNDEPRYS